MLPKEKLKNTAYEKIEEFLRQVKRLRLKLVVLFGSYARGDFTEESDIDVCVVAEDLPENVFERRSLSGLYRVSGLRVVGYFPEEFLKELEKPNFFLHDVLEEGLILHHDESFLKSVMEKRDAVKKKLGLVKEHDGWRILKKGNLGL
ncbi:MAG: nucleotidyltransferase domain-containing protein [Thermoproteota archaeon]